MQHYTRRPEDVDLAGLFAAKFSFGATPQLIAEIDAEGPYQWLDRQLTWQTIPEDPALEATLATFQTLSLEGPQRAVQEMVSLMPKEQRIATLLRAVRGRRHLHEVLVEFWNDHFNVHFESGLTNKTIRDADRDVARAHATGRFADLLHASATSVAMLTYLDNDRSRWPHPNENYARELLELHTLGIAGGYTEADVQQCARALTGWSRTSLQDDDTVFGFTYKPQHHYSDGPIQFMDLAMPAMSGAESIRHGETLLDFLATHPATATHLCTKLARRFVGDRPSDGLVRDLTDAWFASDGSIADVVRALARHPEFHASAGRKVVRPFGALAGMLRSLGDTVTVQLDGGAAAPLSKKLLNVMNRMGQTPFGWAAPNGYPDRAAYWATTGGLLGRWNTALDLVTDRHEGMTFAVAALRQQVDAPTVGELLINLSQRLVCRPPTELEVQALLSLVALPAHAPTGHVPDDVVRALVAAILSTPAAQRR